MAGIWDDPYLGKFDALPRKVRLSAAEGNTPLKFVKLAHLPVIAIKDENYNPTGSFKDRSLAYQISKYLDAGKKMFGISSSGNAAIAAAEYCTIGKAELDIFIAHKINPVKLAKLKKYPKNIRLHLSDQPKSDAIKYCQAKKLINLRGSQDDLALPGFKTIAYELVRQYPKLDAVFLPCSSGTSAQAILEAFRDLGLAIPVYICQTLAIHPIASEFSKGDKTEKSLADAISDRVAHRKEKVVELLKAVKGGGLIISDQELMRAKELLKEAEYSYSFNSLLGFAGLFQLKSAMPKYPVVIATGL